ncbi:MAG: ribonuclease E/G [Alphaproteobacteria bacterium]|nr:ribonuclease E/G [Alphaproteobacteria bacterium]
MTKRMLIDGTHPEETRVAVVEGERLEEFEYESAFRRPLKGSIFLAKVTRVEPSLQAAFVNFGGNRHGFLPFSEIHPDYFRIPISDREALMAEHEEEIQAMEEAEDADDNDDDSNDDVELSDDDDAVEELGGEDAVDDIDDEIIEEDGDDVGNKKPDEPSEDDDLNGNVEGAAGEDDDSKGNQNQRGGRGRGRNNNQRGGRNNNQRGGRGRRNVASSNPKVESFGGDEMDDEQRFRFKMRRKYKIQEVIKRGQIMLIQVSKEERGNKGAAVGSYLSLPGRYCVLMPNSPRAGGISRKISNYKDRAKMRELLKDLEVPKGMSVILRTAGVTRTKAEIKRDLEYLTRLWNNIREKTLESSAPSLVYEEADLVKRAVRDLYTRDVEEIVIAGDEAYKTAKDFMKMMIPSHVKKVKEFTEGAASLYKKFGIERQISEIGETTVTLKSGGYLVINPTEALVSVDVNSGKATKERNIEDTALKTNLEAAEEVARQLRLRDLGGLVVIDFIDMEDRRNNAKVERRMRDSLSGDRARIQMGRISNFGLMEMSRQRMNPSLGESQFEMCPHCEGTGRTRTADAASIMLLRAIEEEAVRGRAAQVIVHVSNDVALYLLNQKRQHLTDIESRYDLSVLIRVDIDMGAMGYRIEVSKPAEKTAQDDAQDNNKSNANSNSNSNSNNTSNNSARNNNQSDDDDGQGGRRRGRRGGRRRGGRDRNNSDENQDQNESNNQQDDKQKDSNPKADDKGDAAEKPKRSRAKKSDDAKDASAPKDDSKSSDEAVVAPGDDKPEVKKKPASRAKKTDDVVKKDDVKKDVAKKDEDAKAKDEKPKASKSKKPEASNDDASAAQQPADDKPITKPKPKAAPKKKEEPDAAKEYETVNAAPKKKKKGWWSK